MQLPGDISTCGATAVVFAQPRTHFGLQSVREPTSIQNDSGLAQSLNRTAMASPATYSHDDVRKTFGPLNRSSAMFNHFALTEVSPAITHASTQADTGSQLVSRVMKLLAVLPAIFLTCLANAAHSDPVDCELNKVVSLALVQVWSLRTGPAAVQQSERKAADIAPPDGYTLLCISDAMCYYPVLYPNLDFDPLKDLTPIAVPVAWSHLMVVSPNVPATTVAELVTYAKANPGKLIFGFGLGTSPQIVGTA